MTPLQMFFDDWRDCTRCSLSGGRSRVVQVRGVIPATVAFCGEAPGQSEDALGLPFVGPAGKLLDQVIKAAFAEAPDTTYAILNLVGCYPREEKKTADHRPPFEAIQACRPRVERLLELVRPRLLVCVGKLAEDYTRPGLRHSVKVPPGIELSAITHPAAVLRMPLVKQDLEVKRMVVVLRNALRLLQVPF